MNIKHYMRNHEAFIKEQLLLNDNRRKLIIVRSKHEKVINFIQHERLVHLLVTLAFGVFLLISTTIAVVKPCHQSLILMGVFFVMLVPYTIHYYFLENTVQHWYKIMDSLDDKIDKYYSVTIFNTGADIKDNTRS